METLYDWLTVAIFAGLIVVFLQRSVGDDEPVDSIWSYLPPSLGCAIANQFGNEALESENTLYHAIAIIMIAAVIAYIVLIIKPFPPRPQDR